MRSLKLSIEAGEKIALVGQSGHLLKIYLSLVLLDLHKMPIYYIGCGKSTIIQLIQRFYDVGKGSLTLENQDIKNLNLPHVRSQLGIVSQEPTLFTKCHANICDEDYHRILFGLHQ